MLSHIPASEKSDAAFLKIIHQPPVVQRVTEVSPRGLFTDIDGTISPIAPTPEEAQLLPGIRDLLREACRSFHVVGVITGRSALGALDLVQLPELTYVGNHGLEWLDHRPAQDESEESVHHLPSAVPYIEAVNATLDQIEEDLGPNIHGLWIERKGVSGSIHVRSAINPEAAEDEIFRAASDLARSRGLQIKRGKKVVEVLPALHVDKGTTIRDLIRRHGLRGAVYFGDDWSDIDAFRTLRELSENNICYTMSIAILHPEAPSDLRREADICLDSVEQVPSAIRWLLSESARERRSARPGKR